MAFKTVTGGFEVSAEDRTVINQQRAITKQVNDQFIQVGAVYLKTSGKIPIDEKWAESNYRDTNLQSWIDDDSLALHNVGFNLQFGWTDIDIDSGDPRFNRNILAALRYLGVDTRFAFGRRSFGAPTHVLVQLNEDEAANFDDLSRFVPKEFKLKQDRYHIEVRSYPTNLADKKNLARAAKQTVMPGSVYLSKTKDNDYDVSVWWGSEGKETGVAKNIRAVASTTPRKASFNLILRAIAFGVFLYIVEQHWTEGQRQSTANKVAGWLARTVKDGQAINNHEALSSDVFCPVDTDDIAEALLEFVCAETGDDEKHMRLRTYRDAVDKLERNPDAKIPGWPAMVALLGAQSVAALRTVFTPGSDVSVLTKLAERYVYDDTDGFYIDRDRHRSNLESFTHEPDKLERRHIDETIMINGKPRPAFRMFETSKMRTRVTGRNMYPQYEPGVILRVDRHENIVGDDEASDETVTMFNTWRGWPITPAEKIDPKLMKQCEEYLDRLLGYLTCDNEEQMAWVKKWIAWTFQFPTVKQQIAWVCVGDQGVGKSFMGTTFLSAIFGSLWGTSSASIIDNKFNVGPFINKMMSFVDEVKFHNESGTQEVMRLIRSVDNPGMEKFSEGRTYKIYSRFYFASNRYDMSLSQSGVLDRALFYTKAYSAKYRNQSDREFRAWAETLKPWFEEFGTFLERRDVREHYVAMFMALPVTKMEVESIRHSSSTDSEIIASNMRPSRRFAQIILEEGRIHEDLHITYPFSMAALGERVDAVATMLHQRPPRTDHVMEEFKQAGLITTLGRNFMFADRWGTAIEKFTEATLAPVNPQFELTEDDYGPNDQQEKRTPWRGGGKGVVAQFKA